MFDFPQSVLHLINIDGITLTSQFIQTRSIATPTSFYFDPVLDEILRGRVFFDYRLKITVKYSADFPE
ncbi:hypothetical protein BRD00_01305 [Halobacteriales archaeon QS_8_69_26]|nr:MAG: hypothetical protein BRD00_01305 [Halobacteriales archaeon QS_8_69_26]